jgi:hypothetical protein
VEPDLVPPRYRARGSSAPAILEVSSSARGLKVFVGAGQNFLDRLARLPIGVPDRKVEGGLPRPAVQESLGDELDVVGNPNLDLQGEIVTTESNQHVLGSFLASQEMGETL